MTRPGFAAVAVTCALIQLVAQMSETEAQLSEARQTGKDLRSQMSDSQRQAADKVLACLSKGTQEECSQADGWQSGVCHAHRDSSVQ